MVHSPTGWRSAGFINSWMSSFMAFREYAATSRMPVSCGFGTDVPGDDDVMVLNHIAAAAVSLKPAAASTGKFTSFVSACVPTIWNAPWPFTPTQRW